MSQYISGYVHYDKTYASDDILDIESKVDIEADECIETCNNNRNCNTFFTWYTWYNYKYRLTCTFQQKASGFKTEYHKYSDLYVKQGIRNYFMDNNL